MRPMSVVAATLFAAVLSMDSLHAQVSPPDTLTLTLEEAYRIAAGSNPAYRQVVNTTTLNGPESRANLFGQILPSVSLNLLSTGYSGRLTQQANDFFGNPILNPTQSFTYSSNTSQSVSLDWTIQGASLFNDRTRQRLTNRDRGLAESSEMAGLRASVRRQFYLVLRERDLLELERSLVEPRRVDLDVAHDLFLLSQITRVDVLNAELAIEQQNIAVNVQDRRYEQVLLFLRTLLGDDGLPPLRLQTEDHAVFDPSGLDLDVLVDRAMDTNPAVRQQGASVESASHGLKESRNTWWPRLQARFTYGRLAQTPGTSGIFDFQPNNDTQSSFSLGLSVPFFGDYFQNQAGIARATVDLDNADEQLRSTRLATAEQVRSAALTLRNGYESHVLAQRSLDIAQEALRLAREEYRLGTRTFEQLRDSINQEALARRQVVEADYSFTDGLVTLEEAVGTTIDGSTTGGGAE